MKKNNYLNRALLIVAMLFVGAAFAIPPDPCLPKDVCCEEPAPGPFAFSYPKDVGLACPRDFYVHGEFLWMKGSEEGLEFGLDNDDTSDGGLIFPLHPGKIKGFSRDSDEWDWRPGFRAGFGFNTMNDFWNISIDWTYIRIKSTIDVNNGGLGNLRALWLPPSGTLGQIAQTSAKWSGDYNTMDIMIGKPYHVSRYFTSNPMFGIRAGWIDQDYLIRYFENQIERDVWLKNDYWGAGLRGYYEAQFIIGSGFLIWGKAAFSLLFGKFDISQQSEAINTTRGYQYYFRVQNRRQLLHSSTKC